MKIPVYTSATFAFILTGCALSSDEMTSRFLTHMSPANPALSGNVGIIAVRERGWGISTMSSYLTTPVLLLNIAGLSSYLTTPVSSALEASLNIAGLLDPYPTLARYKIDVDILDVNYDLFATTAAATIQYTVYDGVGLFLEDIISSQGSPSPGNFNVFSGYSQQHQDRTAIEHAIRNNIREFINRLMASQASGPATTPAPHSGAHAPRSESPPCKQFPNLCY